MASPTREDPASELPSSPGSLRPPSDRIAVVVNGNAKNVTEEVISTLDQILMGGDLFVSKKIEEARDIARMVIQRGYGTVLTGGGDGTFTVMATELVREAQRQERPLPRLGFLKLGTGNALAWVVGASGGKKKALAADIQRLRMDAGSRKIRLIEVEGVIAPFCGFGADAVVLDDYQNVKEMLGKTPFRRWAAGPLAYTISSVTRSLPGILIKGMPHCRVTNTGGEAFRMGEKGRIVGAPIPTGELIYEGPARIAAVSTIPYFGFGFRAFPFAEDRPDKMNLRVSTISTPQFIRHFSSVWRGEYDDRSIMFDWLVDAVHIEVDPPSPFEIGGDSRGNRKAVDVKLTPTEIRLVDFYAPPSAS